MNITEFRQKYPQYSALSDTDLADRLYNKHYADKLEKDDFFQRFGVGVSMEEPAAPVEEEPGWVEGRIANIKAMGQEVGAQIAEVGEIPGRAMATMMGKDPDEGQYSIGGMDLTGTKEELREMATANREIAHESKPENAVAGFATELIDVIADMAPTIVGGRVTKSGGVAYSAMGLTVFSRSMNQYLNDGLSRDEAAKQAIIDVGLELGPDKALGVFDDLPLTRSVKDWAKKALAEGLAEMGTEAATLNEELRRGTYEGSGDLGEDLLRDVGRVGKAGVMGAAAMGVLQKPPRFRRADDVPPPETQRDASGQPMEPVELPPVDWGAETDLGPAQSRTSDYEASFDSSLGPQAPQPAGPATVQEAKDEYERLNAEFEAAWDEFENNQTPENQRRADIANAARLRAQIEKERLEYIKPHIERGLTPEQAEERYQRWMAAKAAREVDSPELRLKALERILDEAPTTEQDPVAEITRTAKEESLAAWEAARKEAENLPEEAKWSWGEFDTTQNEVQLKLDEMFAKREQKRLEDYGKWATEREVLDAAVVDPLYEEQTAGIPIMTIPSEMDTFEGTERVRLSPESQQWAEIGQNLNNVPSSKEGKTGRWVVTGFDRGTQTVFAEWEGSSSHISVKWRLNDPESLTGHPIYDEATGKTDWKHTYYGTKKARDAAAAAPAEQATPKVPAKFFNDVTKTYKEAVRRNDPMYDRTTAPKQADVTKFDWALTDEKTITNARKRAREELEQRTTRTPWLRTPEAYEQAELEAAVQIQADKTAMAEILNESIPNGIVLERDLPPGNFDFESLTSMEPDVDTFVAQPDVLKLEQGKLKEGEFVRMYQLLPDGSVRNLRVQLAEDQSRYEVYVVSQQGIGRRGGKLKEPFLYAVLQNDSLEVLANKKRIEDEKKAERERLLKEAQEKREAKDAEEKAKKQAENEELESALKRYGVKEPGKDVDDAEMARQLALAAGAKGTVPPGQTEGLSPTELVPGVNKKGEQVYERVAKVVPEKELTDAQKIEKGLITEKQFIQNLMRMVDPYFETNVKAFELMQRAIERGYPPRMLRQTLEDAGYDMQDVRGMLDDGAYGDIIGMGKVQLTQNGMRQKKATERIIRAMVESDVMSAAEIINASKLLAHILRTTNPQLGVWTEGKQKGQLKQDITVEDMEAAYKRSLRDTAPVSGTQFSNRDLHIAAMFNISPARAKEAIENFEAEINEDAKSEIARQESRDETVAAAERSKDKAKLAKRAPGLAKARAKAAEAEAREAQYKVPIEQRTKQIEGRLVKYGIEPQLDLNLAATIKRIREKTETMFPEVRYAKQYLVTKQNELINSGEKLSPEGRARLEAFANSLRNNDPEEIMQMAEQAAEDELLSKELQYYEMWEEHWYQEKAATEQAEFVERAREDDKIDQEARLERVSTEELGWRAVPQEIIDLIRTERAATLQAIRENLGQTSEVTFPDPVVIEAKQEADAAEVSVDGVTVKLAQPKPRRLARGEVILERTLSTDKNVDLAKRRAGIMMEDTKVQAGTWVGKVGSRKYTKAEKALKKFKQEPVEFGTFNVQEIGKNHVQELWFNTNVKLPQQEKGVTPDPSIVSLDAPTSDELAEWDSWIVNEAFKHSAFIDPNHKLRSKNKLVIKLLSALSKNYGAGKKHGRVIRIFVEEMTGKVQKHHEYAMDDWANAKVNMPGKWDSSKDKAIMAYLQGTSVEGVEDLTGYKIPEAAIPHLDSLKNSVRQLGILANRVAAFSEPNVVVSIVAGNAYLTRTTKQTEGTLEQVQAAMPELIPIFEEAFPGLNEKELETASVEKLYNTLVNRMPVASEFVQNTTVDGEQYGLKGAGSIPARVYSAPGEAPVVLALLSQPGGSVRKNGYVADAAALRKIILKHDSQQDAKHAINTLVSSLINTEVIKAIATGKVGSDWKIRQARSFMRSESQMIGDAVFHLSKSVKGGKVLLESIEAYRKGSMKQVLDDIVRRFPEVADEAKQIHAEYRLNKRLRELVNEINDPATVLSSTFDSLASTVHSSIFVTKLYNYLQSEGLASFQSEGPTWVPLAAKGSKLGETNFIVHPTHGKVEGAQTALSKKAHEIYVPLDIAQAVSGMAGYNRMADTGLMHTVRSVNNFTKKGKVVWNPLGHARNTSSGALFHAMGGGLIGVDTAYANKIMLGTARAQMGGYGNRGRAWKQRKLTTEGKNLMKVMLDNNILFDGGNLGAVYDLRRQGIGAVNVKSQVKHGVMRPVTAIDEAAMNTFRLEDEAWKGGAIINYAMEELDLTGHDKNLIKKALKGEKLTPEQQKLVDAAWKAGAEQVKNTYPTYSRTPEAIKWISRNLFFGSFPSFTSEMVRNTMHAVHDAFLATKGLTPSGKKIVGKKRAKAVGLAYARVGVRYAGWKAIGAVSSAVLYGLAEVLRGWDGEDDEGRAQVAELSAAVQEAMGRTEKENQELRDLLPFFLQGTDTYVASIDRENRTYVSINTSYLNPYGAFRDIELRYYDRVQAGLSAGKDSPEFQEAMTAAYELSRVFTNSEPLMGSLMDRIERTPSKRKGSSVLRNAANTVDRTTTELIEMLPFIDEGSSIGNVAGALAGTAVSITPEVFPQAYDLITSGLSSYAGEDGAMEVDDWIMAATGNAIGAKVRRHSLDEELPKAIHYEKTAYAKAGTRFKKNMAKILEKGLSEDELYQEMRNQNAARRILFDGIAGRFNTAMVVFNLTPNDIREMDAGFSTAGGNKFGQFIENEYTPVSPRDMYSYLKKSDRDPREIETMIRAYEKAANRYVRDERK